MSKKVLTFVNIFVVVLTLFNIEVDMPKNSYIRTDWEAIAFHTGISKEVQEQIREKFETGLIRTEKLESNGDSPQFAIKISKGKRVICTSHKVTSRDGQSTKNCLIALHEDLGHDFDFTQTQMEGKFKFNPKNFPKDHVSKLDEVISGIANDDSFIFYSKEQNKVAQSIESIDPTFHTQKYCIVNGLAGSGKTTMALDILSTAPRKGMESVYLSKSPRLVEATKQTLTPSSKGEDANEDEATPTEFITYDSLVSDHIFPPNLRDHFKKLSDSNCFKVFKGFVQNNYKKSPHLKNIPLKALIWPRL